MRIWFGDLVPPVLVIHVNQDVAVKAVGRKNHQHRKVRNEQRQIESIDVIQALEGLIEIVGADILCQSARGEEPNANCAGQVQRTVPQSGPVWDFT